MGFHGLGFLEWNEGTLRAGSTTYIGHRCGLWVDISSPRPHVVLGSQFHRCPFEKGLCVWLQLQWVTEIRSSVQMKTVGFESLDGPFLSSAPHSLP